MKKTIFMTLAVLVLLLAGCQRSEEQPTATPEPAAPTEVAAEVPTAEPTEEPTQTAAETEEMADDGEGAMVGALQAHPWQWEYTTTPVEQFDVDNPESYLVTFNEDGTVNIKADCNNAAGSYTDAAGALTITIGPMTLAACPEGLRSDQFLAYLTSAARYHIEDSSLYIDMMADGGILAFAPAGEEATSDNGEGAMAGTLPEEIVAQLDAFLQSQVYTEGGHPQAAAPGLVLLVDTPDGRYLSAAGVSNLDDGTPIQVDDHFEIGSNTKSMTTVVLMQLVEEGVLKLDDPLSQWLPEQAAVLPSGDQITIRQMALHTAGLWDYADKIIGGGLSDPAALEQGYTPEELVQYAADNGTPYFAPGEVRQWQYSNTGYILLGMILEKATGESLAELYQTRIFDPLGLESAVLVEGVPEPGQITTKGYYWEPSTKEGERFDVTNANLSQAWAAGAVAMTAEDLASYGHALAAGEFFHNPETLAEMLAFNPDAGSKLAPYGLGLLDFAGDGTVWGHAGETLGYQSLWFTDPDKGILVVGWTNAGSYKAYSFLNVLNILEGNGAQPITGFTLLPVGDFAPTTWKWLQFSNPEGSTEIDEAAGFQMIINKNGTVLVLSNECGVASGTYTVDGTGQINFDLDDSAVTCDADSLGGQFVQHLKDAARWHFANGDLVVELPADGGSLIFDVVPPV